MFSFYLKHCFNEINVNSVVIRNSIFNHLLIDARSDKYFQLISIVCEDINKYQKMIL